MIALDVESQSDEHLRVTTVSVAGFFDSDWIEATGASRCSGPDKFDPVIGEQLATARALRKMARDLEKNARAIVKQRDLIREKQEAAAAENLRKRKARAAKYAKKAKK